MKNVMNGVYTYNNEDYNFIFATDLSAFNKMIFVKSVVETVVSDNNYNSIIKDLIFDFNIIRVFTDVDTYFVNVKDDDGNTINPIIPIEEFLEETNIVDIVKKNMRIGLLDELNDAVNKSIQYLTGVHTNPISESIASLINTIEKKINEVDLDSMMDMVQKFASMTEDFTVDNIINKYMESDTHKKNLAEIGESRKQRAEFAKDMDKAIKLVVDK
jgi:hypothetical protein